MNATEIQGARISPDGSAAVIATIAPDWQQNRFKEDLWLWTRLQGRVTPLTHSEHDSAPKWSPDSRYIAFLSDRQLTNNESSDDIKDRDETSRVWLIPVSSGEAFPLYREKLDVHAFAWSPDSSSIDFSVTNPLPKDLEDARKLEWKDVIRWREQERGDALLALPIDSAIHVSAKLPEAHQKTNTAGDQPQYPTGTLVVAHNTFEIGEIAPSPSGEQIAFETGPVSHRLEDPAASELYLAATHGSIVQQLTHNQGLEGHLFWNHSGKSIYFLVRAASGSIEGPYQDVQGRIYSVDLQSGKATRFGGDFKGSWEDLTVMQDGKIIASGLTGMDQHLYRIDGSKFESIATIPGNYAQLDASRAGATLPFTYSSTAEPHRVQSV
ncbi:TolB family protein [Granulicella arctica]|uniref:Dipeptidyl aminopeptidase/acylaminoacyl peptidase n=1 Tax=Granulicella arctica TaxID=940613 RepID=A0A7Y9THF6_9BACT|nr:DPP IV N-terminal domain-containing protein [Granulicella arctica]NYF79840.1 dipeptidyl aminopeptidase/acylaminoacyl peptidase [Granulicella arctica]